MSLPGREEKVEMPPVVEVRAAEVVRGASAESGVLRMDWGIAGYSYCNSQLALGVLCP